MKKVIINCFLVLLAVSANAQMKYGVKAGLNYSIVSTNYKVNVEDEGDNPSGIGFHLGGYLVKSFTDKIAFRPELIISRCNLKETSETTETEVFDEVEPPFTATTTQTSEDKVNFTYLDIPLLLDYKMSENLSLQVGPQIGIRTGFKASGSYSATTTYSNGTPAFNTPPSAYSTTSTAGLNSTNIGLALGAIYDTGNGLNFGVRYQRGLNSINSVGTDFYVENWNVLQLSVGYTLSK
jgi:hypothetical protein